MAKKAAGETSSTSKTILDVATREFASHGFSGARMDRIASLAKCNIRMLYHYFSSKEGLYLRVIEESFMRFKQEEDNIRFDIDDPVGSIEEFYKFMCAYFTENQFLDGIIRNENLMEGRFISQIDFTDSMRWIDTKLCALVAAGKERGIVRPDINHIDLYLTIAALSRYHISNRYTLSAILGIDLGNAEWQARRVEQGLDMLRSFIAPREIKPVR